jgi:hypothetical protein
MNGFVGVPLHGQKVTGGHAQRFALVPCRGAIFSGGLMPSRENAVTICPRLPVELRMSSGDMGSQGPWQEASQGEGQPVDNAASRNVGVHSKMKLFKYSWSQRFSGKGKVFNLANKKV